MNDWAQHLIKVGQKLAGLLQEELAENLVSCCIYGSAVRGDAVSKKSGLNLFILLRESNRDTHTAISRIIGKKSNVDAFVVGARGFDHTVRSFSAKFSSIQRHYIVLAGADVLKDLKIDPQLERFLCEQALRNLQLRLGYYYIRRPMGASYEAYLRNAVITLMVNSSEVLRLSGVAVPAKHEARVPLICRKFGIAESTLRGLFDLRHRPEKLTATEESEWHQRLLEALGAIFSWIEENWALDCDDPKAKA